MSVIPFIQLKYSKEPDFSEGNTESKEFLHCSSEKRILFFRIAFIFLIVSRKQMEGIGGLQKECKKNILLTGGS